MKFALLLILASPLGASPLDERIAKAMREMIAAKEVPGAVTLIANRGRVTHLRAMGSAGPSGSPELRKDSIFWIASMTKPITGTAILMLQDDGKLNVRDLVSKYIPELANLKTPSGQPANLTLQHLMTHSSGLAEATNEESRSARKLGDLIPAYASKPMQFEPGSKWQYCQSGINTLGRIVEVVSGQPFEEFLAVRLFRPLGMKDTTFYLSPQQMPRLVTPVKREADGSFTAATVALLNGKPATDRGHFPAANGGLFTTAADYSLFARMILNGGTLKGRKYLRPESVTLMTTIQSGELKTGFTPGNGWGLTWCVVREPQGVTAMLSPGTHGHGGAYGTQAWIDLKNGVVLILMVQRSNFGNGDNSAVRLAFQQAATAE